MDAKVVELLNAMDSNYEHNYLSSVIEIIEEKKINIEVKPFSMKNAVGVTLTDKIVINEKFLISTLINHDPIAYYTTIFTLLHEIAHYMRVTNNIEIFKELNTSVNMIFLNRVKIEEDIANRYAGMQFKRLVGRECHEVAHMLEFNKDEGKFSSQYNSLFFMIRSSGLDYTEFMEKMLL